MALTVVGFCSAPVEGAAGMSVPLHKEGGRYLPAPWSSQPPLSTLPEAELDAARDQGLVTLTDRNWTPVPQGVILYAHPAFADPGPGLFQLAEARGSGGALFVEYLPRSEAVDRMRAWARRLLDDARSILRGRYAARDAARALDSAERARIIAPSPDPEVQSLIYIAAASVLLRRDMKDVLIDASIDLPERVREIERGARDLLDKYGRRIKEQVPTRRLLPIGQKAA